MVSHEQLERELYETGA
jgi:hypothetical protein